MSTEYSMKPKGKTVVKYVPIGTNPEGRTAYKRVEVFVPTTPPPPPDTFPEGVIVRSDSPMAPKKGRNLWTPDAPIPD